MKGTSCVAAYVIAAVMSRVFFVFASRCFFRGRSKLSERRSSLQHFECFVVSRENVEVGFSTRYLPLFTSQIVPKVASWLPVRLQLAVNFGGKKLLENNGMRSVYCLHTNIFIHLRSPTVKTNLYASLRESSSSWTEVSQLDSFRR